MQDLERYKPLVLAVLREIHRGHAAFPKLAVDRVCLRQRAAEALKGQRQLAHMALWIALNRGRSRSESKSESWSIHSRWPKPRSMDRSRHSSASSDLPIML